MTKTAILTTLTTVAVALSLAGCRSQKSVSVSESSSVTAFADSTKTVSDTVSRRVAVSDSSSLDSVSSSASLIEFVDGGGTVTVDSLGNVSLSGVKAVKNFRRERVVAVSRSDTLSEDVSSHHGQENAVRASRTDTAGQTVEKTTGRKWYHSVLSAVAVSVCLAALMWLLFLRIKRKN